MVKYVKLHKYSLLMDNSLFKYFIVNINVYEIS